LNPMINREREKEEIEKKKEREKITKKDRK
jgi:hypothetical protein